MYPRYYCYHITPSGCMTPLCLHFASPPAVSCVIGLIQQPRPPNRKQKPNTIHEPPTPRVGRAVRGRALLRPTGNSQQPQIVRLPGTFAGSTARHADGMRQEPELAHPFSRRTSRESVASTSSKVSSAEKAHAKSLRNAGKEVRLLCCACSSNFLAFIAWFRAARLVLLQVVDSRFANGALIYDGTAAAVMGFIEKEVRNQT